MNNQPESNESLTLVVFGASGDLSHRKLIPALFNLCRKDRLPPYRIIGFSNNDWDDQQFRDSLLEGVQKFAGYKYTPEEWDVFSSHLSYMKGDFTRAEDFQRLEDQLKRLENGPTDRIYYLATPPTFFTAISSNLGQAGMLDEAQGWRRVVIEKPFGSDLASAETLDRTLHTVLRENQIFRIDHYLGKETVQNLLVFRFANTVFDPIWCNDYIDHVQISVAEEEGVGHRAGYYDKAGVLRDMFQNHLLQLLTMIAIDPPDTLKHEDLHARKMEVLKALRPITGESIKENTVRGQYQGYRQEPDVPADSETATYGAMRVFIDNDRWSGVPFYLRSGKSLNKKATEIIIQFTCPQFAVFPMPPAEEITPNILAFCIQPDEGIFQRFEAKVPDTEADMRSVEMEFHYSSAFGPSSIPEAYERLLLDVVQGDHTLFTQDDTTEIAWRWIDPIIQSWESNDRNAPPLETYQPGSWGPDGAANLIGRDKREWLITCGQ